MTHLTGSLSEKIRVEINGMEQGLFIKSRNIHNPVLLFVHGGPGMPEYWLTQRHPTGLEDHLRWSGGNSAVGSFLQPQSSVRKSVSRKALKTLVEDVLNGTNALTDK